MVKWTAGGAPSRRGKRKARLPRVRGLTPHLERVDCSKHALVKRRKLRGGTVQLFNHRGENPARTTLNLQL